MLQNKIYQNFFIEIFKTFLIVVLGLSLIALTVRAVNFLELIVENGYPVSIYFQYSFLNLFGIAPKFIPLAYLVAILVFLIKHLNDSEFLILWTTGVKKIKIINLFMYSSFAVIIFYIIFAVFLTPYALNKSRQLLSNDQLNSFLPTIRSQQFTDTFKGFTFIAENKINKEVQNIFLYDSGNNLDNLSPNSSDISNTTIIAKKGIIDKRNLFLLNGQIISSKNNGEETEIIKFDQLKVNLSQLVTTTIKKTKIQETSTTKLLKCFLSNSLKSEVCKKDAGKEIIPVLVRRIILPLYIPVIALICSFLLIKDNKIYYNKVSVFVYSLALIIFSELVLRYTGINSLIRVFYSLLPFLLFIIFYCFLFFKFSKEVKFQ